MTLAVWIFGSVLTFVLAGRAAWVDLDTRKLPNRMVAQTAAAGWSTFMVTTLTDSSHRPISLLAAVGIVGGPFIVLWLAAPAVLGGGDMKLAVALAPLLGWPTVSHAFLGLILMFAFALPQAIMNRNQAIVFGPYIVGGVAGAWLVGTVGAL